MCSCGLFFLSERRHSCSTSLTDLRRAWIDLGHSPCPTAGSCSGSRNSVSSRPDLPHACRARQASLENVRATWKCPPTATVQDPSLGNILGKRTLQMPVCCPGHYSNAYATASGPAPRHHRAHVAPTSRPAAKTTNSTRAFRRDLSNCISASATRSEQLTPKPVSGPEPPAGDCTQSPRTRTH